MYQFFLFFFFSQKQEKSNKIYWGFYLKQENKMYNEARKIAII